MAPPSSIALRRGKQVLTAAFLLCLVFVFYDELNTFFQRDIAHDLKSVKKYLVGDKGSPLPPVVVHSRNLPRRRMDIPDFRQRFKPPKPKPKPRAAPEFIGPLLSCSSSISSQPSINTDTSSVNNTNDDRIDNDDPNDNRINADKGASTQLLSRWYSPQCTSFYNHSNCWNYDTEKQSRRYPQTISFEDLCYLGRSEATRPAHKGFSDILLMPELKLVYIITRKCGSTMLSNRFHRVLNATHTCESRPDWCHTHGKRCSTACLTKYEVDNYFFFAVARDPVDRFYSGWLQAHKNELKKAFFNWTMNEEEIEAEISRILVSHCDIQEHYESQVMTLSSPVFLPPSSLSSSSPVSQSRDGKVKSMVPIDYLIRFSHLQEDFERMLEIAPLHTGVPIPADMKQQFKQEFEQHRFIRAKTSEDKDAVNRIRSFELDHRIREMFAHDQVCFGGLT